ncbi:MAG: 16S rRNA (cytosine(1402)-N(4))-methyltransferase RsmH [Tannerellaceae bacterium]|jgi:16S rRNA (cytosine1402-N4)-methyltransferase|nr:16S rRNA (cytosine(1402)-N(4))-methyltransferase RsmH [Tannerellaceae bacterium]
MEHKENVYHIPVLAQQSLDGLRINPSGIYVDVTFGGGGHSSALLGRLGAEGRLFGFDQDADAMANIPADSRFVYVHSNFRYLYNYMRYHNVLGKVDGLLADLGVSSHHFDEADRGFSYRHSGLLDMRMNRLSELTAAEVVRTYDEESLARIFDVYGELRQVGRIASAVVKARKIKDVGMVENLLEAVEPFARRDREKKFFAKLFMALRMEVNDEIAALKEMLMHIPATLKSGGRFAVISYHSLEDRLVKNFIKSGNFEGAVRTDFYGNVVSPFLKINTKIITPPPEEVERNPRSRSAKLRIAELI